MKFAYHGEKKAKLEEDVSRGAPATSKPPPPKPPSTLSSDKPSDKGAGKGKWKTGRSSDSKESERKGKDSKGKDDSKGKGGEWDSKGWKTLAKVEEEDCDDAASHYSSKTARDENWGPVNQRREHSYRRRKSENYCVYVDGTWKWKTSPKPDEEATIDGETRKVGFGEFSEWAYAAALTKKKGYAQFLLGETDAQWHGKKRRTDRIRYKE